MREVYIITREGRAYSTEGLKYLTEMVANNYDIYDQLIFVQGQVYNDPEYLAGQLEKSEPSPVVVISAEDGIYSVTGDNDIRIVANTLREASEGTSWEILYGIIK